jgi:hypothetical protein
MASSHDVKYIFTVFGNCINFEQNLGSNYTISLPRGGLNTRKFSLPCKDIRKTSPKTVCLIKDVLWFLEVQSSSTNFPPCWLACKKKIVCRLQSEFSGRSVKQRWIENGGKIIMWRAIWERSVIPGINHIRSWCGTYMHGSLCIEITSRADWKQTGCGCKHGNSAMQMKNGAVTSI